MNESETNGLGCLRKIDVRNVWPREDSDFTRWLAEHLGKLGEELGLDLELERREAPVGTFSLDLLARDGAGRIVIIENQLASTDHDHLGKLLTYAGGRDANIIVWVATDFREEHRQALDWLNQRSTEETEFFGVRVEGWQIDDSRPAPHFTLISDPKMRATTVSKRDRKHQNFFQSLIDALRERGFTRTRRALPRNSCAFPAGCSPRVVYAAAFGKKGRNARVRVELYINGMKGWNKTLFDALLERKEAIETELGFQLKWDPLDGNRPCRIAVFREGSIDDDEAGLDEIKNWMIDRLIAFREVFGPHLDELPGYL